jgi:hypothetical protein
MVDQVTEDAGHGPLVRCTNILQAERHDGVVEVALWVLKAVSMASSEFILIWL